MIRLSVPMLSGLLLAGCLGSLDDRLEFIGESSPSVIAQLSSPLPPEGSSGPSARTLIEGPNALPTCTWAKPTISSMAETNFDYSKRMVNAQPAYDRGLTGHCISVSAVDSGLPFNPPSELPRNRVTANLFNDSPDTDEVAQLLGLSEAFHGTLVAGIIGAESDGVGMHGVAPGVDIWMYTLLFGAQTPYSPTSLDVVALSDKAVAGWVGNSRRSSIVNLSVAFYAPLVQTENPLLPRYTAEEVRQKLPLTIAAAAQADRDPADRGILVWAAGNYRPDYNPLEPDKGSQPTSPELLNGLQAIVPELRGHSVSVVGLQQDGTISSFSNYCGIAANWCIAAPSVCIAGPGAFVPGNNVRYSNPSLQGRFNCNTFSLDSPNYLRAHGTSFAAPIVSGALALIIEAFPGMGNTWAVSRMLQTANKTDYSGSPGFGADYSESYIYGQGLLDIGAAVTPVGGIGLAVPSGRLELPDLTSLLVDRTGLLQGLVSTLTGMDLIALDDLGAPFRLRFDSLPGAVPTAARPFSFRLCRCLHPRLAAGSRN